MAKMTLEFDLETERSDAHTALQANNYKDTIKSILEELRGCYKYDKSFLSKDKTASPQEKNIAKAISERIHTHLMETEVDFFD